MSSLHDAGSANRPVSGSRDDGPVLADCYTMAAVKRILPDSKPTSSQVGWSIDR